AARGAVQADMIKNDKHRAEKRFVEQKDRCGSRRVAGELASCCVTPGPNKKSGHENERQTTRCPVCEFDQRLRVRRHRQELALAKRPMVATSCAGSGSAHVGAPEDDGDVVCKGEPRKARERDSSGFGNTCRRPIWVRETTSGCSQYCSCSGLFDALH